MKRSPFPSPQLLVRGVHVLPFRQDGAFVVVSVTAAGDRLEEQAIPFGADSVGTVMAMWDRLEAADPVPALRVC